MPASRSPGFSPPVWPRLGARRDATRAIGGLAPAVVEIPFSWISPPLVRKPTIAITKAQVTQNGAATAPSWASAAQILQYGLSAALITLDTDCDADPANLATFLTTYEAVPRPRQPTVLFDLLPRTSAEALTILGVGLAQRVRITGAPAGTPPGAVNFIVEGIQHRISDRRFVAWATAALVGATTSAPGPWFRAGSSASGGTDVVPF